MLSLLPHSAFPPASLPSDAVAAVPFSLGAFITTSYWRAIIPMPLVFAMAYLIWRVFRPTWRRLDIEAQDYRGALLARGGYDTRPIVVFLIAALMLTIQEYFGGRNTYEDLVKPWLIRHDASMTPGALVRLAKYDELYSYAWWAFTRVAGYVLVPLPLYKLVFSKESLLDMGLRMRGFSKHLWLYGACLCFVLPAMWLVSRAPDFGSYYPFYKQSSRSVADLLMWEGLYFAQFFALELFFRGLWLGALRQSLGSGAIFSMIVPYCMIHYGKPYLEANGAIIAGIVLGSLSMRTRSIYAGFLVHITVALGMDVLALWHRGAIPHVLWAPG
jgi:membrane protease YdiL (CAAX protease family)